MRRQIIAIRPGRDVVLPKEDSAERALDEITVTFDFEKGRRFEGSFKARPGETVRVNASGGKLEVTFK